VVLLHQPLLFGVLDDVRLLSVLLLVVRCLVRFDFVLVASSPLLVEVLPPLAVVDRLLDLFGGVLLVVEAHVVSELLEGLLVVGVQCDLLLGVM
jgi:hypothetical protein